jgi:hypothetical protein
MEQIRGELVGLETAEEERHELERSERLRFRALRVCGARPRLASAP